MESVQHSLAERLREARERLGLTQKQLADMAGFPAHQIVSQIESGSREVKASELARLAKALHVSVQDLLSDESMRSGARPVAASAQSRGGIEEANFAAHHRRYAFVQGITGSKLR